MHKTAASSYSVWYIALIAYLHYNMVDMKKSSGHNNRLQTTGTTRLNSNYTNYKQFPVVDKIGNIWPKYVHLNLAYTDIN
jgi:hypothetical protein